MSFKKSAVASFLILALVSTGQAQLASALPSPTTLSPKSMLAQLKVASEEYSSSYNRSLFRHWIDEDGDGCDTRDEVLVRESTTTTSCSLAGGRWVSRYDKVSTTNASSFDIDHFIPLKEAWESGAWRWDANTRQRFANDLGYRFSLIAVSASSNRSKSDRDPNNWMPTNSSFRCQYIGRWIAVKFRWSLRIDIAEKQYLSSQVASCGNKAKVALPAKASIGKGSAPKPAPTPTGSPGTDPKFSSCAEAARNGYNGPYYQGVDEEYGWYEDRDNDGIVCE
jgi:hypothetical protein